MRRQNLHGNPPAAWTLARNISAVKDPDEEDDEAVRDRSVAMGRWILFQQHADEDP